MNFVLFSADFYKISGKLGKKLVPFHKNLKDIYIFEEWKMKKKFENLGKEVFIKNITRKNFPLGGDRVFTL